MWLPGWKSLELAYFTWNRKQHQPGIWPVKNPSKLLNEINEIKGKKKQTKKNPVKQDLYNLSVGIKMCPVSHAVHLLPGSRDCCLRKGWEEAVGEITCQAKKQGQRIQRLGVFEEREHGTQASLFSKPLNCHVWDLGFMMEALFKMTLSTSL